MPVESLWTIAERVDLIRRSLDELIVTLHPRISTSKSIRNSYVNSSSSSRSGSSRHLVANGGNVTMLSTEAMVGDGTGEGAREGADDMYSSRGTGAPAMGGTYMYCQ